MWFFFALLSGTLYTISGLITRHILKQQKDPWAFSFFFSAIGALVVSPFFLLNFKVPQTIHLWIFMLGIGLMIVLHNWLSFRSSNFLEASLGGTITKFRLAWTFLLGIFILGEHFSWMKLVGTFLTILASMVIITRFKKPESLKGVAYAFTATFLYATIAISFKYLFQGFSSASLTFFIFFIPMCLNFILMPNALHRAKELLKTNGRSVLLACMFGGLANLAMNQAFSLGEITKVVVIIEAFLVATLIGEHLWLKERDHLFTKILAIILSLLGVFLIKMS
jgi:drug/metabolite transporter (DMT)-like permease